MGTKKWIKTSDMLPMGALWVKTENENIFFAIHNDDGKGLIVYYDNMVQDNSHITHYQTIQRPDK